MRIRDHPQQITPKADHEYSNTPIPYCIHCDLDKPESCETHVYSGDCDADCNVCGEIRDNVSEHIIIVIVEFMQPTCTRAGRSEGTGCQNCGCVMIASVTIAKLGHNYVEIVAQATCTEAGYTLHKCMNKTVSEGGEEVYCTSSYMSDHKPALDHSYDNAVEVGPTCMSAGYTLYYCTGVGCTSAYAGDYVPATDHSYDQSYDVVVPSTCISKGYTMHFCSCGAFYADRVGEVSGHDYQTTVVEATLGKYGYTEHTCSRCKMSYKTDFTAPGVYTYSVAVTHPLGDELDIPAHLTFYICNENDKMWYVVLTPTN